MLGDIMTNIVRLFDEKNLLITLQQDTLGLIHGCSSVQPVKKFVECYEILHLTWDIQQKFPSIWPAIPECDAGALLHLKTLTRELLIFHGPEIPHPDFDFYTIKINNLLRIFRVPKEEYERTR
jgi:hypothetical protein